MYLPKSAFPWGPLALVACCGLTAGCIVMPAAASALLPAEEVIQRERECPEDVAPVVHQGVRYEAPHWGKARGLDQNGGYVQAVDIKTEQVLWTHKLYDIDYSGDMEPDRLDIFITSMSLAPDGLSLLVENEKGRRFSVDVSTRQVLEQPPRLKR